MILALIFLFFFIVSCQSEEEDTSTFSKFIKPDVSLVNTLKATLDDNVGFVFGIPCSNRTEWETRKTTISPTFIRNGASYLGTPQPAWSDSLYLDYYSSGNRQAGQDMMLDRNNRLLPLALAECFYWNGTFATQLNQELLSIANQPTWVWPAHDSKQDSFYGREHFVELGSSYTVGVIAMVLGLLDTSIQPSVRTTVNQRISERITSPVLQSISSIPPDGSNPTKNHWMNANSNWNSVCWGGTVIAASISLPDKAKRATIYSNAFVNGNDYLEVFTSDGWDTEGSMYWNMGYGEYITLRESLLRVTGNSYDLLDNPKARVSSRFPYEAALFKKDGVWFGPDFGDCPPEWSALNENLKEYLDYALGKVQQNGQRVDPPTNKAQGIIIAMFSDLNPVVVLPSSKSTPVYTTNSLRSYFSVPGILIARPSTAATPNGLTAAFKLLGNEGIHSHNDIGSYEIFFNGLKITGEPGGVSYTANSFGVNRFKSEFFNSIGHPVPRVRRQQQITAANRTFNIQSLPKPPFVESTSFTNDIDTIVYDLTGAYAVPSLTSLKRIIKFSREAGNEYVSIEDKFLFSSPSTFETALIAPSGWDFNAKLFWNTAAPNSQLLLSTFSSSNTRFTLTASTISSAEYNRSIQRIALTTSGNVVFGSIGYSFTPQYKCQSSEFLDSTSNTCRSCRNGIPTLDSSKCVCNAGYFWDSTQRLCIQCGENEFSIAGSSSCGLCLWGSSSTAGSAYCITPPGRYWDVSINKVANCPDGTFSLSGALKCTACPSGSVGTKWKQTCTCKDGYAFNGVTATCDLCQPGTFALSGSTSCRTCPPGSYSPAGASTCTKCLPGTSTNNQTGLGECIPCAPGKSTNGKIGFSFCVDCPAGRYTPLGSPSCLLCEAGTFSASVGSESCTDCKLNEYSTVGQTSCRACFNGANAESSNTVCPCLDTQFFSKNGNSCNRCTSGAGTTCNCPSGKTWSGKTSSCV